MAEAKAWVIIPKSDKKSTEIVLDMRPLVLCKDCKHRGNSEKCVLSAISEEKDIPLFMLDKHGAWFCGDGETDNAD